MQLNLIQWICIAITLFVLVMSTACTIFRNDAIISVRQYKYLIIAFCACMLVFVYYFVPNSVIRWDLFVHYDGVNALRGHDFSYALKNGGYGTYYLATLYFWLISRLPDNTLLPFFPLLLDLSVFYYIFFDRLCEEYGERQCVPYLRAFFVFFAWLSTFGFKLAVSGLRCVAACALSSLAVYLYCKKKRLLNSAILLIAAALIHSYALIIVPIALLSKIKNKTPVVITMIGVNLFGARVLELVNNIIPSSMAYVKVALMQAIRYWDSYSIQAIYKRSGLGMAILFICMIIYIGILFLISRRYKGQIPKDSDANAMIVEYTQTLSLFSLGMCFSYLFMERTMYLVSYATVMLFSINQDKHKINLIIKVIMVGLLLYIFYSNDIGTFIANYTR